jgi:RNA polymerase sigma factor (sigma-70 family)
MEAESLFLSHLHVIDRTLEGICRRQGLFGDAADDFCGWARARLIENDYAAIRKFEGRSAFATYLVVVLTRFVLDYNVQRWGRWRSSAEARRLGDVAVHAERLLYRDGYSVSEAASALRHAGAMTLSDRAFAELAAQIPPRARPREVGDGVLAAIAGPALADDAVRQTEQAAAWARVRDALADALHELDPEDQLILRMRFWDGASVADIARALHCEQKPLYRRIERQLAQLRGRLVDEGVDRATLSELLVERV